MASISLTVDNAKVPRIVEAVRFYHPEFKALNDSDAVKQFLISHVVSSVFQYEQLKEKTNFQSSITKDDTLAT